MQGDCSFFKEHQNRHERCLILLFFCYKKRNMKAFGECVCGVVLSWFYSFYFVFCLYLTSWINETYLCKWFCRAATVPCIILLMLTLILWSMTFNIATREWGRKRNWYMLFGKSFLVYLIYFPIPLQGVVIALHT